ncbi:PREDICTED: gem-associated protein 5-like [Dufourea novaeangliae]|uniref:Gem-associated protein 5 n=1 Tax=Dufourea novaeangliae TaxID=178035 RepID=A0A154PRA4_DUFNO|nr:PREDICTED: gem-associated protein 5-like [Dufourea novaeangliae]KZC13808.1 Gem-associated protein 5 [Dufourea novaeangliae]
MNETTLPPSPNWYLSNILAYSFNGTVAWGARKTIVVVKSNENEKALQYSIIKHAHKDRVTCLAFTPQFEEVNSNLLASTGDDNIVKVWDSETLSIAYSYSFGTNQQAIGVDWSYKDPFVLYSASSDGCILSWNVHFNTISSILLGKVTPTCISSCPHDQHIVAVGSKSGLVYVLNFQGKGTIMYKLRGHDTEVVSLSWCPSEQNVINGNHNRDLLLASGGKDRLIYIWRAGGDGRYEMTISLPSGPLDCHQHRSKLNSTVGNWIAIRWIEPKLLLTSSFWGELISWHLSTMTKGKPTYKLIHAQHSRGLFCIAHRPSVQENLIEDWRIKKRYKIWTLAQDRRVICCEMKENNIEIVCDIYTQSGYVYCIAACPLDTSRIAFGVGDAMLRLWNLSEAHCNTFDITVLWQKIKGKIRTIAWHPEKENLLAYATEEGRIGVFDTNGNKPPTLYRQYHRKIVYTIIWGPCPESKQYVLYSCAEGELVFYDPVKPNQEPTSVIKKECTGFNWKPDFSCLAVGFENGSISFLNRKFKMCGYAKFSSVMVYCLAWHPESTATDSTYSPLRNYLAVAFESCKLIVFDLSNFMDHLTKLENSTENDNEKTFDSYKVHEVVANLTGHVHSIVCLAWNPYISGQLISGSYDSTAQVWNVETQELIATYTQHSGPVLCCMWSPLDPNYIITGSLDFTVRIWKVTDNNPVAPQEKVHTKSAKKNKDKQIKTNKIVDTSIQNSVTDLTNTMSECSVSNVSQPLQKLKTVPMKEEVKKKKREKTYFVKSSKIMDNTTQLLNSLVNIVKTTERENGNIEEDQEDISYHMSPFLFSTKENFMSFFADNKYAHIEEGRHDVATEMDIWCDNLKENLDEAVKEKRLNDSLVSLSASLSMKTWKEMCELYAYQLISDGKAHKAVSYLLCIHKTYKAIEVLQNANLHKEAYALARCRLESDDPVLTNVLQDWAKYSAHIGLFEDVAYIYAKLGDFSNTVKYLARRKDPTTLITAAEIALLCNDDILSKSLAEEAIIAAFKNSEYNLVRNIITKFTYLKYQEVHIIVVEKLRQVIERNVIPDSVQLWLNGELKDGMLQVFEITCKDYYPCYDDLRQSSICNTLDNEEMLWLTVSYEIALAVISPEKQQRLKHIVSALGTISQFETLHRNNHEYHPNFLIEVIMKLDNRNPTKEESIYAKTDYPVSVSLRAYLCSAFLNWFVNNINEEYVNVNMHVYINLIENLIDDALNKQAVKQWLITNEINKVESQVASALCKTQEENENEQTAESLVQKLNALKVEKKQLVDDLVCVPNPVMVYSKANELAGKLTDETIKSTFLDIVSKAWTNATS